MSLARDISSQWEALRRFENHGPLVNSEYYPGWLTHWKEKLQRVSTRSVVSSLKYIKITYIFHLIDEFLSINRQMLDANASVNIYMFFGGTNFGFTAG